MIKPPRVLIWITLAVLVVISGVTYFIYDTELPPSIKVSIKGQPTIGYPKAKVHVVVFEEPKCSNCRDYNDQVFPTIKKEFVDTNKITYTVIPVSFLPGSMPAAIATLCVYYSDPVYPNSDLFFKFLDYIYEHQPKESTDWANAEALVKMASEASPAIHLSKLRKCIEMDTYRLEIEKNTNYGKRIMGGRISTPTVYVNGIEVPELSIDGVRKLINQVLEHEGVH